MNPYDVDYTKFKESELITDERDLLKLKLFAAFHDATIKMTVEEIIEITKLDKSDVSRLRTFGIDRFTIDRLIGILETLGVSTEMSFKPRKKPSKNKKAP
jgi:predicted XRE-type DNA-binding protein